MTEQANDLGAARPLGRAGTAIALVLGASVLLLGARSVFSSDVAAQREADLLEALEAGLNETASLLDADVDSLDEDMKAAELWEDWLREGSGHGSGALMHGLMRLREVPAPRLSRRVVPPYTDGLPLEIRLRLAELHRLADRSASERLHGHEALLAQVDLTLDHGAWFWLEGEEITGHALSYRGSVFDLYETEIRGPVRSLVRSLARRRARFAELQALNLELWSIVRARRQELAR